MTGPRLALARRRTGTAERRWPIQGGGLGEHDAPEETRGSRGAWVGAPLERGARDVTAVFGWARPSPASGSEAEGVFPGRQVRK